MDRRQSNRPDRLETRRKSGRLSWHPLFESFPEDAVLERGLRTVLINHIPGVARNANITREPNAYRGAFPSEIITISLSTGRRIRLFVKYFVPEIHDGHGYWRDIDYEARVYREILGGLSLPLPKCYGVFHVSDAGRQCLVLQFLSSALRLNQCPPGTILLAARWIGLLHAAAEVPARESAQRFLSRYRNAYFAGWAHRTSKFARPLRKDLPWVEGVCDRFVDSIPHLVSSERTVIHGEFYPGNIMVRKGKVYPVDWSAAAIGPGEVDLASLTEGWEHTGLVEECEQEYCRIRWPAGRPKGFTRALALARVYWPLRWLGQEGDPIDRPAAVHHLKQLKKEAVNAGLL